MALHERLGKILRTLKLRRGSRGSEDPQPTRTKNIDHAGSERSFGSDDGKRHAFTLRKVGQRFVAFVRNILKALVARRAAVTRRDEDVLYARRASQPPRERVLAPAAADHQQLHLGYSPCDRGGGVNLLHIVEVFEDVEQLLHPVGVIAG